MLNGCVGHIPQVRLLYVGHTRLHLLRTPCCPQHLLPPHCQLSVMGNTSPSSSKQMVLEIMQASGAHSSLQFCCALQSSKTPTATLSIKILGVRTFVLNPSYEVRQMACRWSRDKGQGSRAGKSLLSPLQMRLR